MFSDMVCYTALMQQNEQLATDKRRRLKEVLEEAVSLHHGKILQYYGDGALSIFNSAIAGAKGDWKKAAEIFEDLRRSMKHPLRGLYPLGCAYAKTGATEKTLDCIHKIEQWQVEEPDMVLDMDLAMIWLSIGDMDQAYHYLFQCVEKRMGAVAMIIEHPAFRPAADDPRYHLLKEKLNLVEW